MLRVPPSGAYLELEPQPAAKIAYTERDIQIKRLKREYDQSQTGEERRTKSQSKQGIKKEIKQAKRTKKGLPKAGILKGLDRSLKASAKGTMRPSRAGLFGPRRNII